MIPSSEEFFNKYSNLCQFEEGNPEYLADKEDFKTAMIEFAKLHVQLALEAALQQLNDEGANHVRDSILSSYPLDKII